MNQSDVPASRRAEYVRLLAEFEDTISADQDDIGFTNVTQHNIELPQGMNDPAFKGQFRLAFEHLQLIKDNVVSWLKNGLIEKSNSKFNAPVFCVPKAYGRGIRVVLDYHSLNDKAVPDRYSIRTTDQCIEEIGRAGSKIFSCLDLTSGFWQLKLDPALRPYSAFTVPGMGKYPWKVMPFGLMGGPASFSRLMDLIMEGADNTITYIDDIMVHSSSHADHLKHLRVACLLYTSPSPRDKRQSRMPSSA